MADLSTENNATLLTVSELNRLSKLALERNLPSCRVVGEISNFSRAGSGHWYFTLKDASASVRAVMFRNRNQFVDWMPRDGDHVELRAQPTLYENRGDYQLQVDALRKGGQGQLFEAFLQLKEKLQREGLFEPSRKRVPPEVPNRIGVITSPQAAALRDVISTLASRWPLLSVVVVPTSVQGDGSVAGIVSAIEIANEQALCDLLLLVRGGGSLEDLHAFNDERVARAIANSRLPIISGIGHETDFTIADFVADARAPTPTGAAQMATPTKSERLNHVQSNRRKLAAGITQKLGVLAQRLDNLMRQLRHPEERSQVKRHELQALRWRLARSIDDQISAQRRRLESGIQPLAILKNRTASFRNEIIKLQDLATKACANQLDRISTRWMSCHQQLHLLDPDAVLLRGYCVVRDGHGQILTSAGQAAPGESVTITLSKGMIEADVTRVTSG